MTTVLSIVGGVATIVGGVYGIAKLIAWALRQPPEAAKESIDKQVADEEAAVEKTGRPQ